MYSCMEYAEMRDAYDPSEDVHYFKNIIKKIYEKYIPIKIYKCNRIKLIDIYNILKNNSKTFNISYYNFCICFKKYDIIIKKGIYKCNIIDYIYFNNLFNITTSFYNYYFKL